MFENTGIEPLVTLRYFGPDANPDAPAVGDYKKSALNHKQFKIETA